VAERHVLARKVTLNQVEAEEEDVDLVVQEELAEQGLVSDET